eukprot:scaffold23225_cov206-Cylindrotheca_fusiformis.AAC.1
MSLTIPVFLVLLSPAAGFGNALFQKVPTDQQTFASGTPDRVEIELPNFDELFGRVQQVSPLARLAIESNGETEGYSRGFNDIRETSGKLRPQCEDEKSLAYTQGLGPPLLRFRATLEGPCIGEGFANLITNNEDRRKWDDQLDHVVEAYPVLDFDAVNMAMGFKYGDCSRLGVGHCVTKPNFGIDAREQLTLCGINNFPDDSCLIWGTEMESWHDHLLPPGKRVTRAKSHIFTNTLVPTSENTMDVEYVIQLDIG